jgi:hypothetical protein
MLDLDARLYIKLFSIPCTAVWLLARSKGILMFLFCMLVSDPLSLYILQKKQKTSWVSSLDGLLQACFYFFGGREAVYLPPIPLYLCSCFLVFSWYCIIGICRWLYHIWATYWLGCWLCLAFPVGLVGFPAWILGYVFCYVGYQGNSLVF